jgi:ABC-type transport system involved in cytochrome bd biosynthesis fused ATPase/permease subunit
MAKDEVLIHDLMERVEAKGASLVRVAVLALVAAMGLSAMGIAPSIINLAFGLVLGSGALAFGLGAKETAGRIAEKWAAEYLADEGQIVTQPQSDR